MKIYTVSTGKSFTANLHFVVYDSANFLVAASYADLDTTVKAISASAIDGRSFSILNDNNGLIIRLDSTPGDYRRVERVANGPITHGVIIHKAAAFDDNHETPVVLAPDGDLRSAVGKMMAARYALPKEWINKYFDLIPDEGIEKLNVIVNPLNKTYRNLKAIRISADYATEEYVLNEIDRWLKEGKLTIPKVDSDMPRGQFNPGWSMKEYLTANAHVLADQLKNVRPHHVPGVDPLDPAIAKMKRLPFPSQAHMIQGLYNCLKGQFTAFCGADMGCGKTIMSLGVAHLMRTKKKGMSVLAMVPGITIPKWVSEIAKTLPDSRVRTIYSTNDAAEYARMVKNGYKPDKLEFILIGTDRAKLGPEPWCSAIWKRVSWGRHNAWHCPHCGQVLEDPKAEEEGMPAFWNCLAHGEPPERSGRLFQITNIPKYGDTNWKPIHLRDTNNLPLGFKVKWDRKSKLKKCNHCQTKLWRPAVKSRGETKNRPRYYISRIFKNLGKHFDLFICDEVHQVKAQDSGRGDAFAQLIKSAKKCLFLTGTLVNGKSTSIKEILWRTDPGALIKEGFNRKTGTIAWASKYGVLKRVTRVTEQDSGITTRRKRVQLQPTEEPGIAPQMVAQYLLHKAAFMELGDLGLPVVELKEIPVFLDMDPDMADDYRDFHDTLYNKCKQLAAIGIKGAFSKFISSTINYADRPDLGAFVKLGCDENAEVVIAPEYAEDYYHAKERELVKIVRKELSENRPVFIGAFYTDSYGVHWRIQKVLENHGIKAEVLTSSVPSEKRVDWLEQKKDARVIISNMRLVEVGLDLIPWKTIVLYQLSYDVNTVRQFARRNWRLLQDRESRVYYLVYNGTQQMSQFLNVMKKRGHALMAEGRLDKSELSEFARDAHSAMASDLAGCLADAGVVSNQWTTLAQKDLDQKLKLVKEADFKDELERAMKELAQETRRLCGVDTIAQPTVTSNRPTFEDMWAQLQDNKQPKRHRKKKQQENQINLLDFGLGTS